MKLCFLRIKVKIQNQAGRLMKIKFIKMYSLYFNWTITAKFGRLHILIGNATIKSLMYILFKRHQ